MSYIVYIQFCYRETLLVN